jgi:acyl-CoA dehydrogenase
MSDLLLDTASRLFAAHCGKAVLDKAEAGEFPSALWRAIDDAGLATALVPEERGGPGIGVAEALAMLRVAGRHAAPVPFAETLLAGWLLGSAGLDIPEGPLSIAPVNHRDALSLERRGGGWRLTGTAQRVPWGGQVKAVVGLAGTMVARIDAGVAGVTADRNLAGEPRDTLVFEVDLPAGAVGETKVTRDVLFTMGAAARTLQIAGALAHVLEITTSYAQQRPW